MDHAVQPDRTAHNDVERLWQRLGQGCQQPTLLLPGLGDAGAGRGAAEMAGTFLKAGIGPDLQILKSV